MQFLKRAYLFAQFFAIANDLIGRHRRVDTALLLLLSFDQSRHAIEGYAPVIANDPSASICIGQPGENVRTAAASDIGSVGIEDPFVVRLAIFCECFDHGGIRLVAIGLESIDDHAEAAVGHDGPFERSLCLQTDDDLVFPIDVARCVRGDRAGNLRDVEHSFFALLDKEFVQAIPDLFRALGSGRQEGSIALIGLVVLLDEVANIDLFLPETRPKSASTASLPRFRRCCHSHIFVLKFSSDQRFQATAWYDGRSSVLR